MTIRGRLVANVRLPSIADGSFLGPAFDLNQTLFSSNSSETDRIAEFAPIQTLSYPGIAESDPPARTGVRFVSYPQLKFKPDPEIKEALLADAPQIPVEPVIQVATKSHWISAVAFWLIVFGLIGGVGYIAGIRATIVGLAIIIGLLVLFGIRVVNDTVEL